MGVIAARLASIRAGEDPDLLGRVPSGFVVLSQAQPTAVRGCCMLIPDPIVASPNDLDPAARAQFFSDMVLVGDTILSVTGAERINYLVLCNQAPELHAHCIPRFAAEDPELRRLSPFAAYDFGGAPVADVAGPDRELHRHLQAALAALL